MRVAADQVTASGSATSSSRDGAAGAVDDPVRAGGHEEPAGRVGDVAGRGVAGWVEHLFGEAGVDLGQRLIDHLALGEHEVRRAGDAVESLDRRRRGVDPVGPAGDHRPAVARDVDRANVGVPGAVREAPGDRRQIRSRRNQSRAVGRAGERGEIVAVEGDARESVAGGAPGDRDRRVGVRLAVTVRGRGQGARRARSAGVDPVGTGVHCGRAVAGGIAGPHVEVPVRAVGRGRAGEGRSRLLGRGIRHRRGSLIEGDRVARDAVGVDRTREGEIDVDVARPGREGMARRSDREAGGPGGVDRVGTARRDGGSGSPPRRPRRRARTRCRRRGSPSCPRGWRSSCPGRRTPAVSPSL